MTAPLVRRALLIAAFALAPTAAGTATAATTPTASSAARIVVKGTFKRLEGRTITYTSSRGTYTATWVGIRQYRLAGTIAGKRLSGTIRTKQAADGDSYVATGSGRLGRRTVKIGGGGANDLKTSTLILT